MAAGIGVEVVSHQSVAVLPDVERLLPKGCKYIAEINGLLRAGYDTMLIVAHHPGRFNGKQGCLFDAVLQGNDLADENIIQKIAASTIMPVKQVSNQPGQPPDHRAC